MNFFDKFFQNIFGSLRDNFNVRAFIGYGSANKKRVGKVFDKRAKADALNNTKNFDIIIQNNHLAGNFIIKSLLGRKFFA